MSRTHAARMLLALGPLSFRDFHAITGWTARQCTRVLNNLHDRGEAVRDRLWRLA